VSAPSWIVSIEAAIELEGLVTRKLAIKQESWPIAGTFTISRGSKTAADVVVVELEEGGKTGRGECVPYARYKESIGSVVETIEKLRGAIEGGVGRARLRNIQGPGAARNAIDCALWDLEAKLAGKPAWQLAELAPPKDVTTAYTLSLDTPQKMAEAAKANAARPLLKLKLAGPEDFTRVKSVHQAAPGAKLIVDANEGWTLDDYRTLSPKLKELGVVLIEQPLPADKDLALLEVDPSVPVCADESCHDLTTLRTLKGRYQAVNLKLDKSGGLTEALAMVAEAKRLEFQIMVGCMVGTSLAMAPAFLVAQEAQFVDLDGPLLLAKDRPGGFAFDGSVMHPNGPALWG
jgi:L-alanine-DL-glutamate epimerase-like enolase superfamily enzyme